MTTRREALEGLIRGAEAVGWAGADPYDGLNSAIGRIAIPFGPPARLLLIQSVLRSPHARKWIRPRPSVNPKGLALFLGAVVRGHHVLGEEESRRLARQLVDTLRACRVPRRAGTGWGYPFPWQSRYFYAPAGTPNAVVTATVGWQLLEAADALDDPNARALAEMAAGFLMYDLCWTDLSDGASAVSYTPFDRSRVVNVSGLVARLLARFGERTLAARLLAFIERAQKPHGGWSYSLEARGKWEDSFHTGFVLECLLDLRAQGLPVSEEGLLRGFAAYRRFFDADGGARLYSSAGSSYDAHSAAQGMITFAAAAGADGGTAIVGCDPTQMVDRIAAWTMARLWIDRTSRFAHRWTARRRDETDYLRWVQGWMALGLATAATIGADSKSVSAVEQMA